MKKILVVEDNPDLRQILFMQLEIMGFYPVGAKDGREGVEMARKENPALILMDIMMPVLDGREAARIIRSSPETRKIPILAATAFAREVDLNSVLEAGCNDFLLKPFTFKDLRSKVEALISGAGKSNA